MFFWLPSHSQNNTVRSKNAFEIRVAYNDIVRSFSLLGALKVTLEYCGESIMKLSNLFYRPPMLALRQVVAVKWVLAVEQNPVTCCLGGGP